MRLTTSVRGLEHHLTVPAHDDLRVGTLRSILGAVATYLDKPVDDVVQDLFG
jgi:hypothetical protein